MPYTVIFYIPAEAVSAVVGSLRGFGVELTSKLEGPLWLPPLVAAPDTLPPPVKLAGRLLGPDWGSPFCCWSWVRYAQSYLTPMWSNLRNSGRIRLRIQFYLFLPAAQRLRLRLLFVVLVIVVIIVGWGTFGLLFLQSLLATNFIVVVGKGTFHSGETKMQ